MTNQFIEYRKGYKYQLATDYLIKINIKPKKDIDEKFIKLDKKGTLIVLGGYAWDGPSGPVRDKKEAMRGSLVHDALYQLMRHQLLDAEKYKDAADKWFEKICITDGVSLTKAHAYYLGLKIGGKPATDPKNKKKIHRAP